MTSARTVAIGTSYSVWSAARAVGTAIGLGTLTLPFLLTLSVPMPRVGEPVFVVFSPFAASAGPVLAVARAGGELVAATSLSFVLVAIAPDAGFAQRLSAEGALAVRAARGDWTCIGLSSDSGATP